jgi:hypothetical protein
MSLQILHGRPSISRTRCPVPNLEDLHNLLNPGQAYVRRDQLTEFTGHLRQLRSVITKFLDYDKTFEQRLNVQHDLITSAFLNVTNTWNFIHFQLERYRIYVQAQARALAIPTEEDQRQIQKTFARIHKYAYQFRNLNTNVNWLLNTDTQTAQVQFQHDFSQEYVTALNYQMNNGFVNDQSWILFASNVCMSRWMLVLIGSIDGLIEAGTQKWDGWRWEMGPDN